MPAFGLSYDGPPPASAAWREGEPVGDRRFVDVGALTTESGFTLPDVRVAYETWGQLTADGTNAIFKQHLRIEHGARPRNGDGQPGQHGVDQTKGVAAQGLAAAPTEKTRPFNGRVLVSGCLAHDRLRKPS